MKISKSKIFINTSKVEYPFFKVYHVQIMILKYKDQNTVFFEKSGKIPEITYE